MGFDTRFLLGGDPATGKGNLLLRGVQYGLSEGFVLVFQGCLHMPAREAEGLWVDVDKQTSTPLVSKMSFR